MRISRSCISGIGLMMLLLVLGRPAMTSAQPQLRPHSDQVEAYRRPYGPNAPWNVPVEGLPRHPQSDVYRDRLWNDAPAARAGNFNLNFGYEGYTYPVYHTTEATGEFPVATDWDTNIDAKRIPWNPAWVPAAGSDAQVILLDPLHGYEWNLWQVSFDGSTIHATNGNLVQVGEQKGDGGTPGNYWVKENGFAPSRGCGIQYFATLVVPEEIADGEIRHALSMPIINTDGEFYVPPATKLEYPDHPPNGIPEGMRFALQVSDAEIEAWVSSLPPSLPDTTRNSARIIARALRDYGWFITDSSGGAMLQFEDYHTAGGEWEALGLGATSLDSKEYPRDLLDGLITRDRIYALVPSDQYPQSTSATFADVPLDHPYYNEIEALYQAGYTAGCSADPLLYCPEQTMNRAESAVFVERGIHSVSFTPPTPSTQVFGDLALDSWAAGWVNSLWEDRYTAGCGKDPLIYCPWQGHSRAEGCVFYLRMLNGADYLPPQPSQQVFADVPLDAWYAGWVHAAYNAGLLEPCQVSPERRFCPNDPLSRAQAAYMMVQAKGLGTVEAATVVAKWKDNKKAAFTFTFDDSNSSEAAIGLPYLIKKGLAASWYIVPGKSSYTTGTSCGYSVYGENCGCSSDNCSLSPPYDCPCWVCKDPNCFKSWEQEAVNSGQDLANHTWEHGWTSCEDADLKIKMTADYIRNLTGKPEHSLQGFEYPGSGTSNCSASSIFAILEKYYLVKKTDIRTAGSVYPDMDEAGEMAAFVTNLISDGDWRGLNIESLLPGSGFSPVKCSEYEAFVDWLTTKQDELWIGTYLDVYKYQNERNAAQVTVLESTTSRIRLNLTLTGEPIPPASYPAWDWDWSLFDYPLTLITDVPSSWDACEITQGTQTKTYPVVGGKVMYDALPNGGEILLRAAGYSANPADVIRGGAVHAADFRQVLAAWGTAVAALVENLFAIAKIQG